MTTTLHQLPTKFTIPTITLASPVKRCYLVPHAEQLRGGRSPSFRRSSSSKSLYFSRVPSVAFAARACSGREIRDSVDRPCIRAGAAAMLIESEDDVEVVYDSRSDGAASGGVSRSTVVSTGRQERRRRNEGSVLAGDTIESVQMRPGLLGSAPLVLGYRQITELVEASVRDFVGAVGLIDTNRAPFGASAQLQASVTSQVKMTDQKIKSWRKWDHTRLGKRLNGSYPPDSMPLTVMTYNILAQQYIVDYSYLYRQCPSDALRWEIRSQLLLEEIAYYRPDILCLQEVQEDHFFGQLCEAFAKEGYTGFFKKKTGEKPDGCAVLFKRDKFELINYTTPEFQVRDVRILDREQIGVIAQLVPTGKSEEDSFFVATTHLLYNPHRDDVRLAQLQVFFAELDRVAFCGTDSSIGNLPRYKPIILCGDFNTLPFTPVYDFVTEGSLQFAGCRAASLSTDNRGRVLGNELLPAKLALTDNCQHAHVVAERLAWAGCPDNVIKEYAYDEYSYSVRKNIVPRPLSPGASPSIGCKGDPKPGEISRNFWCLDYVPLSGQSSRDSTRSRRHGGSSSSTSRSLSRGSGSSPPRRRRRRLHGSTLRSRELEEEEGCEDPVDRSRRPYGSGALRHNFDFCSVYRHRFDHLPRRPYEVTTYQDRWVTVDYIFYTTPYNHRSRRREENRLQLLSRFRCLNPHQCDTLGKAPTDGVPSDHFPIMARFLLRLKSKKHRPSSL